jgi:ketosteroid isomerase-like protein
MYRAERYQHPQNVVLADIDALGAARQGAGSPREGLGSMDLDEHRARVILESTLAAWSNADIDALVSHFVDDMTYFCNTGGPDGGPLTIVGKRTYREMLQQIVDVAESVCVSEYFRFANGVGRAKIECYIRHKTTRHTLVGSYRQLITYRGDRIERMEEFHDAAKMIAFWQMISGEAAIEKALLAD